MSFETVMLPVKDEAEVPSQNILAVPIVALLPAADRLPPTFAFEVGPPSGWLEPLSPGAARAGEAPGNSRAVSTIVSTTSHDNRRARCERGREVEAVMADPRARKMRR